MGERPSGLTLDRIDTNGDYSPENCRWASRKEQYLGRRDASKHIGVCWSSQKQKWQARVTTGKSCKHIGFYSDLEEAIKARQLAVTL